ncbi:glucosidase II beta subunit-like-domain-containing protein [Pilobolus umbonatus]|nr:glucosidase II beta subunit-like-domain-containing protein [Pilobolus umbonatus]
MVSFIYKLPCILTAIVLVNASIKGLDPQMESLYQATPEGTWTCLDNSQVIPHTAINDDYCDCADSSDEPGTSACPQSMFYCVNEGHISAYIKSYAVNDGVCDEACCDGSDEDGSLASCPNRCKEVGEVYRREQSALKKSNEAGMVAKQKLIEDALKQHSAWEEEKIKLEDELVLKKSDLLKAQREVNKLESNKVKPDIQKCPSTTLEIAALRQHVSQLQKEVETLTTILGDMKRDHNHNFHDMAVKSAISGYDEFVPRYARIIANIEEDLAMMDEERESHENEEDVAEDSSEETIQEDTTNQVKEKGKLESLLDKLDSVIPTVLKNGLLNNQKSTDKETKESNTLEADLETARQLVTKVESEISKLNRDLTVINNNLEADYGADNVWMKLKDVCIEKNEGEYTYSLCFLGDAYQKSNKDSTRTHLG